MSTDDLLRTAVQRYCAFISRDRLLVQAAGGNVSWKAGDTLWIKASGTWLADAEHKEIFVPVDLLAINAALTRGDYDIIPRIQKGYTLRPSIETLLHALMPHKFVVHLHPVDAMVHLTRENPRAHFQAVIGETFRWDVVDYHRPGADLAKAVHSTICKKPSVQVLLLKNHGVILGAETIEEIDQHLQTLSRLLHNRARELDNCKRSVIGFGGIELKGTNYQPCPDVALQCLATESDLYERLGDSWAICPDHVVFLGERATRVDSRSPLLSELLSVDAATPFIFVQDQGILENNAVTPAQKAQLTFYFDVMVRQPAGQILASLNEEQIHILLNWDAEKYRRTLNTAPAR